MALRIVYFVYIVIILAILNLAMSSSINDIVYYCDNKTVKKGKITELKVKMFNHNNNIEIDGYLILNTNDFKTNKKEVNCGK